MLHHGSLAAAGCQAMLRTARQEAPQGAWTSVIIDDLSSCRTPPAHASVDDTLVAGIAFQPRMLPHSEGGFVHASNSAVSGMSPIVGEWAITGGLGSIGMLTADWMAASSHSSSLWLLSRTAHSAAATHFAPHPTAQISICQCDVSSAADANGWAQMQTRSGLSPLSGLLHVSGVLQDALIPNQTMGSLREVAAGKLMGGLQLCGVTGNAPVTATMLFSSTAAILGPPGQANYAAANAMLNHVSDQQYLAGRLLHHLLDVVAGE